MYVLYSTRPYINRDYHQLTTVLRIPKPSDLIPEKSRMLLFNSTDASSNVFNSKSNSHICALMAAEGPSWARAISKAYELY